MDGGWPNLFRGFREVEHGPAVRDEIGAFLLDGQPGERPSLAFLLGLEEAGALVAALRVKLERAMGLAWNVVLPGNRRDIVEAHDGTEFDRVHRDLGDLIQGGHAIFEFGRGVIAVERSRHAEHGQVVVREFRPERFPLAGSRGSDRQLRKDVMDDLLRFGEADGLLERGALGVRQGRHGWGHFAAAQGSGHHQTNKREGLHLHLPG